MKIAINRPGKFLVGLILLSLFAGLFKHGVWPAIEVMLQSRSILLMLFALLVAAAFISVVVSFISEVMKSMTDVGDGSEEHF